MDRKRFITLFALTLVGFSRGAIARTIQERVEMAHRRIEVGVRSGALTREEAHRLRDELNRVRRDEDRARADGHLDRRERERLNRELTRLERHIFRFRNNDPMRGDGSRGMRR